MTVLILLGAVLAFVHYLGGARLVGGLLVAVLVVVGLYMAAVFHLRFEELHPQAAQLHTCTTAELADHHDGWGAGWHPAGCDAPRQRQAFLPDTEYGFSSPTGPHLPEADPKPVATAPASPASGWEIIPWPADAPSAGSPSPAAQRLLDRLNGWVR